MASGSPYEAARIYQDLLDRINDAYATGDFGAFAELVYVPHHLRTSTKTYVLRDRDQLKKMFEEFISHLTNLRVDNFIRECKSAEFRGADRIEGDHLSHMLRGTDYVEPMFRSRSLLMRVGQSWMVCASENRVNENSASCQALEAAIIKSVGGNNSNPQPSNGVGKYERS